MANGKESDQAFLTLDVRYWLDNKLYGRHNIVLNLGISLKGVVQRSCYYPEIMTHELR